MEQTPSWGANTSSVIQEIPSILWNTHVHYRIQNSPLSARAIKSMSQHLTSWRIILKLSSHLSSNWFFPSCLPTKTLYTNLLHPIRATCPAHLILLYVITRIFGKDTDHKVPRCVVFSIPLISSLWGPNILLNTLFSNTTHWVATQKSAVLIYLAAETCNHAPSAYVPPSVWATKFPTHTKLQSCIF
jgi:hypothetical protein